MSDPKDVFKRELEDAVRKLAPDAKVEIHVERPKNPEHGDLSSNAAMQLARQLKKNPMELAKQLVALLPPGVEIAKPGFLNVRLKAATKLSAVAQALKEGEAFGRKSTANLQKAQVEFVSANPTGPLHVGHGRQAALGDAIAALLESQGERVTREFYYNDAGAQVDKLAWSVQARARGIKPGQPGWPEEGYAGEYIEDISREVKNVDDLDGIRRLAVAYLRKEQDADLQAFGVKFDVYYLESSLYTDGKVDETVNGLVKSGKTFEKDGALWLRTTDYGDDKDRVVPPISSRTSPTTSRNGSAVSAR